MASRSTPRKMATRLPPQENGEPLNPQENGEPPVEPEGPSRLPENRDYIEIPARDAKGQPNVVIIDVSVMTEEEKAFYYEIPDKDLNMILEDLENIITTAVPGRFAPGLEAQLNELAAINGYESIAECGLLPLYVDGGQEHGFTVQMKLVIGEGVLNRTDIYVYHLTADNRLECLGPAEVHTYPDGSVETLQFSTNYVTTYFTSYDGELSMQARAAQSTGAAQQASEPQQQDPGNDEPPVPAPEPVPESGPSFLIPVVIICAVICIGLGIFLGWRRKK